MEDTKKVLTPEEAAAAMSDSDDLFNTDNEAAGGLFWKPEVGESIKGTFIEKKELPGKGIYPAQIAYHILTDTDEEVVCAFNINKKFFHSAMKRAKIGQIVGFVRTEDFETDAHKKDPKNVKPAHTYKVYLGKMNQKWLYGLEEVIGGPAIPEFS